MSNIATPGIYSSWFGYQSEITWLVVQMCKFNNSSDICWRIEKNVNKLVGIRHTVWYVFNFSFTYFKSSIKNNYNFMHTKLRKYFRRLARKYSVHYEGFVLLLVVWVYVKFARSSVAAYFRFLIHFQLPNFKTHFKSLIFSISEFFQLSKLLKMSITSWVRWFLEEI